MVDPGTGSGNLPETGSGQWSKLLQLTPFVGTLVTIASNPQRWLAKIINVWVVGGTLEAGAYVLGWLVFASDRTATIIGDVAGPLASPFRIVEDGVVGAIETIYGAALGVAHAAGLAGPPAAAFAVALISAMLAAVVFAVWRAFPATEALGAGLEAIRP
jgi:hypothetical protein